MAKLKYHPSVFTIIGILIFIAGLSSPLIFGAFKIPLVLSIVISISITVIGNNYLSNLEKQVSYKIGFIKSKLTKSMNDIDNPRSILKKIQLIDEGLEIIKNYLTVIDFLYFDNAYIEEKGHFQKQITLLLGVLYTLRSKLQAHIELHVKLLKNAKSEVSTHVKGNRELNQVSELQRARLDKQIAQFEELQRVLVKV